MFTVNLRFHRFLQSTVIGVWLTLGAPLWVAAETWRFALIGDTPYSDYERNELPKMLQAIADYGAEFVVHVGDIKHSKDRCDDALFTDRLAVFSASRIPLVLVPGDNEWSDCDRLNSGGYQPQERLNTLRRLFWSRPDALGQKRLPLQRQAAPWLEHSRFRIGPVLFVTLNLPGGNNHWGLAEQPSPEFSERNPQVLAWLRDSFALARRERLAGIALLFQANPEFKSHAQGLSHAGYREFLDLLRDETQRFPGRVLAVHGDTHTSRIDQPLRDAQGKIIKNFTRVETHGYPFMGWTLGVIDSDDPQLWRFTPHRWPSP